MPQSTEIKTAQDWARQNKTARRVSYALILGCMVTFAMGQTILFTLLGPLGREIGLQEYQVGLITTCSGLAMALIQPVWGRRSDHWGRKAVIVFGLIAYGLTTILFTYFVQIGLWGWVAPLPLFGMLVIARVLYALTSSGIQPAASAFVADTTEGRERTQGLALVGAAAGVGTAAGPVLGASLVGIGVLVPLYTAAGLALVMGTTALLFLREPPAHVRATPKNRLRVLDTRILPYLIITLFLLTAAAGTYQTAAFYVQDRLSTGTAGTAQLVGWAMGAAAIVTILTQGVVVQWLKPAPAVLVRVGLLIGTTAFIFLSYTKAYEGLVFGYMIMGVSVGLLNPGLLSAASLSVGADEQGAVAGLVGSAMSAGFIFGPALGAGLYEYGQIVPLQVNAVIMGVMLVGSLFLAFGPRSAHLEQPGRGRPPAKGSGHPQGFEGLR